MVQIHGLKDFGGSTAVTGATPAKSAEHRERGLRFGDLGRQAGHHRRRRGPRAGETQP